MRSMVVACGVIVGLLGCGNTALGVGGDDDDGSDGGTVGPTADAATDASDRDASADAASGSDGSMQPQPLGQDTGGIAFMRADATHLYWALDGNATIIRRMPLAGGPIEPLYTGVGWAMGLAVRDGFVYTAQRRGTPFNDVDLIVRFPTSGGAATTIVSPIGVRNLDVDGDWVYYGDTPDFPPRVMKVATMGGNPHFIVRARAGSTPYELRASGGFVFYVDDAEITRIDIQTKQLTTLSGGRAGTQIAVDDTFVYFIGCASGGCSTATAFRVPRAGGATETLGGDLSAASRIDVIGDSLQWGPRVLSMTGGAERILLDTPHPCAVAATADAYYFGDSVTGTIYRAAR